MTLKKYYASELQATEPVYLASDVEARDREVIEYIKSMENCSTWVDLAHVRKTLLARLEGQAKEAQP